MKFEIRKLEGNFGTQILIREFSEADFKGLLKLLKNLGLSRDKVAEMNLRRYARKGMITLFERRSGSKLKARFSLFRHNLSVFLGHLSGVMLTEGIYVGETGDFQFSYQKSSSFLAGTWKSSIISGEEFASLILGNA